MSHLYSTYISPLDSLVFESIIEPNNDLETAAEKANLALWTNAQFTYDVQPGTGILDDLSTKTSPMLTEASSPSSSITYENLANYLDYELPQHIATAAPPPKTPNAPPLLLPKIVPAMTLEEITKAFITTPLPPPKTNKRPLETITPTPVEEDKRKRNTAASARFRIKKKEREQTMEKTVKEMTAKSNGLENRVKELELEIKWLRGLLIEKNSATKMDESSVELPSSKNEEVKLEL